MVLGWILSSHTEEDTTAESCHDGDDKVDQLVLWHSSSALLSHLVGDPIAACASKDADKNSGNEDRDETEAKVEEWPSESLSVGRLLMKRSGLTPMA